MTADMVALASRVRAEIVELEQIIERAERLHKKAQESVDADYLDGVALNLHGFYAGVERIFEEIARDLDDSVPSGPEWHRHLLMQMSVELSNVRPPVIHRRTRECLDEYRGFRHVVRHVYAFNLRPSRLQELVADLRACYLKLTGDITAFCDFLASQDTSQEL